MPIDVASYNSGGAATSYALTTGSLAPGSTLDTVTGTISDPTASYTGTHNVTITGTNATGSDTLQLELIYSAGVSGGTGSGAETFTVAPFTWTYDGNGISILKGTNNQLSLNVVITEPGGEPWNDNLPSLGGVTFEHAGVTFDSDGQIDCDPATAPIAPHTDTVNGICTIVVTSGPTLQIPYVLVG